MMENSDSEIHDKISVLFKNNITQSIFYNNELLLCFLKF